MDSLEINHFLEIMKIQRSSGWKYSGGTIPDRRSLKIQETTVVQKNAETNLIAEKPNGLPTTYNLLPAIYFIGN